MTSVSFSHEMALGLEEIEVLAWSDLYAAAPPAVVERTGVTIRPMGGGCVSMVPKVDVLGMNRVFGFGLREPVDRTDLISLIEQYHEAGARRFFVQVNPYAMSSNLPGWLKAEGFAHYNNWIKLYRSVENLPSVKTDLAIRPITEPGAFGAIVAAGFDWPEDVAPWIGSTVGRQAWRHYMAFDGEKPVATGAFYAEGEFAWLDLASTLPEARGRGRNRHSCIGGPVMPLPWGAGG